MSGIAAIIHFDGRPADPKLIRGMTSRMAYRGPDGATQLVEGSVGLGQCTFHTTAESMDAILPLVDESGQVILIMDGRIDNYHELRILLLERGACLRSRADAELALKAYMMFGEDAASHIDGDFALLLWDRRLRKVFGLRDAMGHRPFYYIHTADSLCVASDIAPLLDLPWVQAIPNERMIAQFASLSLVGRDETLWAGVMRLPPANKMTVTAQGLTVEEYWAPDPGAPCPVSSEEAFSEYYGALLDDAVRRRTRSHKRVACEVSGGLDSSAILASAVALDRTGGLMAPGIDAYTLLFEGIEEADDLPFARSLAAFLKKEVIECAAVSLPLSWYSEQAKARLDFPGFPNNGVLHHNLWSTARARESTSVLSGLGGDEWLDVGTDAVYKDAFAAFSLSAIGQIVRADVTAYGGKETASRLMRYGLAAHLPETVRGVLRGLMGRPQPMWSTPHSRLSASMVAQWETLNDDPEIQGPAARTVAQAYFERTRRSAFRSLGYEICEREASRMGVELRMPYNDRRIIELAYSAPAWWMRRGKFTKFAHRRAFRSRLPETILTRTTKAQVGSLYAKHASEIMARLDRTHQDKHPWLSQEFWQALKEDNVLDQDHLFSLWCLFGCDLVHGDISQADPKL